MIFMSVVKKKKNLCGFCNFLSFVDFTGEIFVREFCFHKKKHRNDLEKNKFSSRLLEWAYEIKLVTISFFEWNRELGRAGEKSEATKKLVFIPFCPSEN